ncbi:hypothetical protein Agub_g5240 [Astrephomene gubernaculifera]|uniref:Wax synthase domain-containing protein n=1 Tax=Astrephomene gubernaculifera TaxID=47775 RepID=A0AAD3DLK0_9CHLO|nr:hypothetical protein Agub_g5240 [Astrephomene gubernaculifera]
MQPPYIDTGTPFGVRVLTLTVLYVAFSIWVKYVIGRSPVGFQRLILSIPVFVVSIASPWLFNSNDELLTRISCAFIFSWLCTSKVLAFCLGRAPLREGMTAPQIAAVMILPVFPKPPERAKTGPVGRLHDTAGTGWVLAGRWMGKVVVLGLIAYIALTYGDSLPQVLRHYMHIMGLYSFVGFLMDGPAALAVEALELPLVPTFDEPWKSCSLADFWGRRWNITTSSVLRVLLYDCIVDGALINPRRSSTAEPVGPPAKTPATPAAQDAAPEGQQSGGKQQQQRQQQGAGAVAGRGTKPSMFRRQLGLHATFLASGLIHEYILWTVSGTGKWGWRWCLFFYMQAPLMTAEAYLGRLMRRAGLHAPLLLRIALTHAVIERMSGPLFFVPVERDTDLAARVIRATTANYLALLEPLGPLLGPLAAQVGQQLGPLLTAASAPFKA